MNRSEQLYARALRLMPGGVSSPVRAFKAMGRTPAFIDRARGPYLWDVDGRRYIDYVASWGPLILGHAARPVVAAVRQAASRGTSYGAPTEAESELAEMILSAYPSADRLRLVSTGTEACMSAVRAARAWSKRATVLMFDGAYHGHSDGLIPWSAGVPDAVKRTTVSVPYNDLGAVRRALKQHKVACVIVEPVAGNMGVVPAARGFLRGLRKLTAADGAALIFDEVITGFRVFATRGMKPDLTIWGKIVGGGLPLAAYGGRDEIMSMIAPEGPVYQAGTLSGNPVAVAAGIATLGELRRRRYSELDRMARALEEGLLERARLRGISGCVNRVGSMLTLFFQRGPVTDHESAGRSDMGRFAAFCRMMHDQGVYWPPAPLEAAFVSFAHTSVHIQRTLRAADEAFKRI